MTLAPGDRSFLVEGPESAPLTVALAHGAGAPMDAPFMNSVAAGLAAAGHRVARFEFPYMAARRHGRRPPPDPERVLLASWRDVVAHLAPAQGLVIGGKSLGGRMASLVADELGVRGLICLGYPFHPPGRPEKLRTGHLAGLSTPTLIVQGTRDPFGRPGEVASYALAPSIRVVWIEDGDHGLMPPRRSARTGAGNLVEAVAAVADFLASLAPRGRAREAAPDEPPPAPGERTW